MISSASCLLLFSRERRGQSLIEILVATAVGALFVIAAATLVTPALRANTQAFRAQTGAALGRELLANVRVWSEGSWNNIWNLARCPSNHYYLNTAASPFASSSGEESITIATTTYKRYFCVTNVTRDSGDLITTGAGSNDPSTLEVDVFYSWPKSATASISMYLTRNRSNSFVQTDWSGGPGQTGPATTTNNKFTTSTKIDYTTTPGSISLNLVLQPAKGSVGSWANATPLPSAIYVHSAVVYNGYIYAIGGVDSGGADTSTVFYAPISSTGTVGTWSTAATQLPGAIYNHSAVVYNGYIYTTGGADAGGTTSTVFYAPISSTGTVGTWSATTKLPSKLYYHSAVVNNGYIYTTGGNTGVAATSTVFQAPISSTGTVGTWSTAATQLPSAINEHSAVVYNGYIYTIGGADSGGAVTSTVFQAPISSTGTVGTWSTAATQLPGAIRQLSAVVYNGYIYTTGGTDAVAPTSTVFYAPISSTGTVGSWSMANPLPSAIFWHSAVMNNGYIYMTGGNTGVAATSSVFSAKIN